MRAILKLIVTGCVAALFGYADSVELYAAAGAALLVLPFSIIAIDRLGRRTPAPVDAKRIASFADKAAVTMNVMPLPRPARVDPNNDDIEGKTVRAPMSHEEAYEMHARYAPAFDQQAAIARYEAEYGAPTTGATPQLDPPNPTRFDQGRYAQALEYADAFEAQLSQQRRTAAYQVAQPRRIARGSYTPQQYRAADNQPAGAWDEPKTLIGVKPGAKPAK